MPNVINIFAYANFRHFIRDYQNARKSLDRSFSKAKFCRLLGLPNTRSYLTNVLRDRHVTPEFVERFVKAMDLKKEEAHYFRVLVQFNQSQNELERDVLFDQLISLNKSPRKIVPQEAYEFYREWHHSTIRALLDVVEVDDNYDVIKKKLIPLVSLEKIKDSIALMKKLKLIKKNKSGFFKPTDKSVSAGNYVHDELIKQYQLKCFEMGKLELISPSKTPRNFSTINLSVSDDMYSKLEQKLKEFKSSIYSMVQKDQLPADKVYQLNIQFYPQTK